MRAAVANDRHLQEQVRVALEAVTPPAPWLTARVIDDLRNREEGTDMKVQVESRRGLPVALVVAALIAAAVVAALIASRALFPPTPAPVGVQDHATAQYVAMVEADDEQYRAAQRPTTCNEFGYDSPACRQKVQNAITAMEKFQADLERAHPPAGMASRHQLLKADVDRMVVMGKRHQGYIEAKNFAALFAEGAEFSAAIIKYTSDVTHISNREPVPLPPEYRAPSRPTEGDTLGQIP
jgi:hypothetical protein